MSRIRVLSYNVRYDNRNDGHDAWYARRDGVANLVRFHRPDVVGFQEPLPGQRRDLRERLPGYAFVSRGREPNGEGEGCPIGVRTDRWRIDDAETFWLGETTTESTTDWGAAHPRIATWARVRPRDSPDGAVAPADSTVLVVNTHFDHLSARARRKSARLLAKRLPELATTSDDDTEEPLPVVFVGDLNCTSGSEPHQILTGNASSGDGDVRDTDASDFHETETTTLHDAAAEADVRHGPRTSLTDFGSLIDGRRIDHVLVSPAIDVEAFGTLADRDDRGRYPSDHLPVLARLRL